MEVRSVPEVKPTNPKDAIGIKKVPMSCLSSQAVTLIARSYEIDGLSRFDTGDVVLSEQWNAALANSMCYWEGLNDSRQPPHWARMMARIMVIRSAELEGRLKDDRTRNMGLHVKELNAAAAKVIEQYPDCVPPFCHSPEFKPAFRIAVNIADDTPFHLLPWRVVMEMALGMMEGGRKYGRHNYREAGVRASVYFDATTRHMADYIEGTAIDKDSGLSHLAKALSSSQVLLDSMIMGNWVDDRPIRVPC